MLAYAAVREATSPAQVRVIDSDGKATPRVPITPPAPDEASLGLWQPGDTSAAGDVSRVATSITYVMPQLGEQPVDRHVVAQSGDRLLPRVPDQQRGRMMFEPIAISPVQAAANIRSASDRSCSASSNRSALAGVPIVGCPSPIRFTAIPTPRGSRECSAERSGFRPLQQPPPSSRATLPARLPSQRVAAAPPVYHVRRNLAPPTPGQSTT